MLHRLFDTETSAQWYTKNIILSRRLKYTIWKRNNVWTNRILVTYYYNIISSGVERNKTIFRPGLAWRNCVRVLVETFLLLRTIILLLFDNARRTIIYILMLVVNVVRLVPNTYICISVAGRKGPGWATFIVIYIECIHNERALQTWPITYHDYLICEKRKLSSRNIQWGLLE